MRFLTFLILSVLFAQVFSRCGQHEYLNHMLKRDPSLKERMKEEELKVHSSRALKRDDTVYTFPVVVHIIYNNADQNISDGLILDQIARLNLDYRKLNSQKYTLSQFEPLASDTNIQFILSPKDPNGNPSNGITRTHTTYPSFPTSGDPGFANNCQKSITGGQNGWDTKRFMNIWVCNLTGDKLGFAQLPGGINDTDGIVISSSYFGYRSNPPYNLGRTLTHETGHWFNLMHPWGDNEGDCNEDDHVTDTPQSYNASYQCELTKNTCSNLNMVQNFMDYSDDDCMTMFSAGQVARMRAELVVPTGRRSANYITNYNETAPGASGNYTSPYGPLPGDPSPNPIKDPTGGGLTLDDFKHGKYLYILIAVAGCLGLVLIIAFCGALRRCCSRRH